MQMQTVLEQAELLCKDWVTCPRSRKSSTMRKSVGRGTRAMSQSVRSSIEGADLRNQIIRSLRAQGFRILNGAIVPPEELSKDRIRKLHEMAVEHRLVRGP